MSVRKGQRPNTIIVEARTVGEYLDDLREVFPDRPEVWAYAEHWADYRAGRLERYDDRGYGDLPANLTEAIRGDIDFSARNGMLLGSRIASYHRRFVAPRQGPRRKSSRMRDSQRSKVYAAEEVLFDRYDQKPEKRFTTVEQCQAYVDAIVDSAWWQRRVPKVKHVEVRPGHGARNGFQRRRTITLPRWARKEAVILHELTHVAVTYTDGPQVPPHGREFCAFYLTLVRRQMGDDAWRRLKDRFREKKVKHTRRSRTREMTPEQKQAAAERLAKARAAKERA